jgi:hypothetical protein
VEKHGRERQATDGNIIRHMHCLCWINKATDLDTEHGTYCFSMATKVMERRLSLSLYVHFVSCI